MYHHGVVTTDPRSMCRPESWKLRYIMDMFAFIIAGDHEGLAWQSHPSISPEGYVWRYWCGQIIFIIMVRLSQALGACADLKVALLLLHGRVSSLQVTMKV